MVRDSSESPPEGHALAMLHTKQTLTNNVLWKRKEQLAKWESSETNRVPSIRKAVKDSKVQFTEADVFLSACLSGDFDEVQTLLDNGADINTCTVDGLTALHQAVIDGKPEMVQFLVEHGASLNAQDNEGWTPLHAAACCGNVDLVEYLCSEGADISVTNSDKELAVDLAEEDDCRVVLEEEHQRKGIDPNECRNREMMMMRRDAEEWIRDGEYRDRPHSRTGATALHVAAAKGYTDVLRLLLRAGADVNCRDRDGWTPLHAAAHWAEHDAAALLIQSGASLSELTNSGDSIIGVADKEIVEYLEGMQEKERSRLAANNSVNVLMQANAPLKRAGSTTSVLRMSTEEKTKKTKLDEQDENKELRDGRYSLIIEEKSPSPSVEARLPCPPSNHETSETPSERSSKSTSASEDRSSTSASAESRSEEETKPMDVGKADQKMERNASADVSSSDALASSEERSSDERSSESPTVITLPKPPYANSFQRNEVVSSRLANATESSTAVGSTRPSWLHDGRRVLPAVHRDTRDAPLSPSPTPAHDLAALKKNSTVPAVTATAVPATTTSTTTSGAVTTAGSGGISGSSSVQRCASTPSSLPWMSLYRNQSGQGPTHPAFAQFQTAVRQSASSTAFANRQTPASAQTPSAPTASAITLHPMQPRSSITPPTEPNMPKESEAERRSKAKRQRDSRRSTQGVTREQLRAATVAAARREEKENDVQWSSYRHDSSSTPSQESTPSGDSVSSTSETVVPTSTATTLDVGSVAPSPSHTPSASNLRRRAQVPRAARRGTGPVSVDDVQSAFGALAVNQHQKVSDSVTSSSSSVSAALPQPTPSTSSSSNAVTRVVVSMRDRPTTAPQSVVSHANSISASRFGSGAASGRLATAPLVAPQKSSQDFVDYKALYEKERAEKEKEREEKERLKHKLEEVTSEKSLFNANGSSTSLIRRSLGKLGSPSLSKSTSSTSLEDQERRTYERRIAELEYELKQMEHLRSDNQKLKEENGALIRVISKLSK